MPLGKIFTQMNTMSDNDLFVLLSKGDESALSELFSRYYDSLMHYGYQITPQESLIEECIQELFLYLFEFYQRLGPVRNVKAYLYSSLRRRVIDKVKTHRKRYFSEQPLLPATDILFQEDALLLTEQEVRKALIEVLNNLPWQQREAIYLKYYNHLSTKEIAEVLGIANQTVLNTLHIALKKIRKDPTLRELMGYLVPFVVVLYNLG